MSGSADSSSPADRLAFSNSIENGRAAMGAASRVAQCQARLGELACGLLDLPAGSTYATAAALMFGRLSNDLRPLD